MTTPAERMAEGILNLRSGSGVIVTVATGYVGGAIFTEGSSPPIEEGDALYWHHGGRAGTVAECAAWMDAHAKPEVG